MAQRVVLLTGGTGLIGGEITDILSRNGFRVHILSRQPEENTPENVFHYHWDIQQQNIDTNCFKDVKYVMHYKGITRLNIEPKYTSLENSNLQVLMQLIK